MVPNFNKISDAHLDLIRQMETADRCVDVSVAVRQDEHDPFFEEVVTIFTSPANASETVVTGMTLDEHVEFVEQTLRAEMTGQKTLKPSSLLLDLLGFAIVLHASQKADITWTIPDASDIAPTFKSEPAFSDMKTLCMPSMKARKVVYVISPGDEEPELAVRYGGVVKPGEISAPGDMTLTLEENLVELFSAVHMECAHQVPRISSMEIGRGLRKLNDARLDIASGATPVESLATVLRPAYVNLLGAPFAIPPLYN